MKLMIASTPSELITALHLKCQYYSFAEFDLLLVGNKFLDADEIVQRAGQSGVFRRAVYMDSSKIPSSIAYAYYDEIVMEAYPYMDSLIPLIQALQSSNAFLTLAGFISSYRGDKFLLSQFATALPGAYSKLFVFNKAIIGKDIRAYDMSATNSRNIRDLCNFILGYQPVNSTSLQTIGYPPSYTPACFKPKSILLDMTTTTSDVMLRSMYQVCLMYDSNASVFVAPEVKSHPIWGGNISVYRQQYPLELLAINGALDELLVVIPQTGCLSNLHLLQNQNVRAVIVSNEKNFLASPLAAEISTIYGKNPCISVASVADLGSLLEA